MGDSDTGDLPIGEYGANPQIIQQENVIMSVNTLQQGTHTFKVRAKDNFNNWGNSSTRVIKIDSIPPGVNHIQGNGTVTTDNYFG